VGLMWQVCLDCPGLRDWVEVHCTCGSSGCAGWSLDGVRLSCPGLDLMRYGSSLLRYGSLVSWEYSSPNDPVCFEFACCRRSSGIGDGVLDGSAVYSAGCLVWYCLGSDLVSLCFCTPPDTQVGSEESRLWADETEGRNPVFGLVKLKGLVTLVVLT
jgi:hypothetical protein